MVSSTAILIDVINANSNLSIVLWFATRPTKHLRGFSEDQTGTSSFEEVPQTVTAKAIVLFPPSSDNVPCLDIQATLPSSTPTLQLLAEKCCFKYCTLVMLMPPDQVQDNLNSNMHYDSKELQQHNRKLNVYK